MRLIRSATSVGFFTGLSRLLGFAREWLQAHYIGASLVSDALNYAISFPSFFRRIFAEGAFNASFIPLFTEILTRDGVQEARRFAEYVFSLLSGVVTLIVMIVLFFADCIFPVLLPGFASDPERLQLTIEFTRITFPFLLLISLTAFFSGLLNSFERFVAAASSPAVGNIAIIAILVLLSDFGMNPGPSLSYAILACGIVQFLWVFIPSQRGQMPIRLKAPSLTPSVRLFLKRMLPAALGASVVQINLIVDMILSSYLPQGAFSYLKYADRFNQLPLSIIGTAISTALLPLLSKQIRQGLYEDFILSQNRAIEFTLFLILPSMLGLIFLAPHLIEAFYVHGKFTIEDVWPTAQTLMIMASGLPAYVLVKVFNTTFFARGDTRTPVITALISVGINFVLNISLIWTYHQLGMAFATSVASWVNVLMLGVLLWRQNLLRIDQKLKMFFIKFIASNLCLGIYLWKINPLVHVFLRDWIPVSWAVVLLDIGVTIGIYAMLSTLFRVFSIATIRENFLTD